jgi:hypothetical protein
VLETTNDQDVNAEPAMTVCGNNGLSGWRKNTAVLRVGRYFKPCATNILMPRKLMSVSMRVHITHPK